MNILSDTARFIRAALSPKEQRILARAVAIAVDGSLTETGADPVRRICEWIKGNLTAAEAAQIIKELQLFSSGAPAEDRKPTPAMDSATFARGWFKAKAKLETQSPFPDANRLKVTAPGAQSTVGHLEFPDAGRLKK